MKFRSIAASLALILPVLAACHSDDSLNPPPTPDVPSGGAIFQRYVSMGNSITAGFQSAGIKDSTQSRSYAVLLSKAMGTTFVYPSLNRPGCPPPFINNVAQRRDSLPGIPGPITGSSCFLRAGNVLPNNVAVPGARATEILTNFGVPVSASNALTLAQAWRYTSDDVLLHALPIFHAHGLFVALHTTLLNGSGMIFCPKFDPAETLRLLAKATLFMSSRRSFVCMKVKALPWVARYVPAATRTSRSVLVYCVPTCARAAWRVLKARGQLVPSPPWGAD